jgi:cell division protein FtsL
MVKDEKSVKNPSQVAAKIGALSMREKVMLIALAVVALIVAIVYFLFMPLLTAAADARSEQGELRTRKAELQMTIAKTQEFQDEIVAAQKRTDAATRAYLEPMLPEVLDDLITGLITDAGLDPQSLVMTALAPEAVPAYAAGRLEAANPPDVTTGAALAAANADISPAAYVYNVTASAKGTFEDLQTLMSAAKARAGVYLMSFSFNAPASVIAGEAKQSADGLTTYALSFKVYIYAKEAALPTP